MSNPLIVAYTESDFIGKMIFLALLLLSMVSWTILIQKGLAFRLIKRKGRDLMKQFDAIKTQPLSLDIKTERHPFSEIYQHLKDQTLLLLRKNQTGFEEEKPVILSTSDIDLIHSSLSSTIGHHSKSLESYLYILSTVVTLGPFLGLLGTVWGILTTFAAMSTRDSGQTSEAILSGLAMALGTTILGLLVAIPALIAYNYLKNSSRELQMDMQDFASKAVATVEVHYRKVEIT
ncbi:MAG: MotA/TolQ/ExbB proton channel family protein [Chlamydiota bacterium]